MTFAAPDPVEYAAPVTTMTAPGTVEYSVSVTTITEPGTVVTQPEDRGNDYFSDQCCPRRMACRLLPTRPFLSVETSGYIYKTRVHALHE